MSAPVHILASVRNDDLVDAATLVFKTLRIGFPTAHVTVTLNNWIDDSRWREVMRACNSARVDCTGYTKETTNHHEWVLNLIQAHSEPFWICDTDVVFFHEVQQLDLLDVPLAGRHIPQFFCQFANAITRSRLHTCLLWIDPVKVKELALRYISQFPDYYCTPRPSLKDLVYPRYIPQLGGKAHFYDTCSLLYQTIGGHSFGPDKLDCFEHLNSGTLSDLVAKAYPENRIRETHFSIFENPQLAKGSWKIQDEFYAKHAC